jgi:hypothetical protein
VEIEQPHSSSSDVGVDDGSLYVGVGSLSVVDEGLLYVGIDLLYVGGLELGLYEGLGVASESPRS